jgi:hypothetical protein
MSGRVGWAVLALGIALIGYGIIDNIRAGSDYRVTFRYPGDKCNSAFINLHADTGEPLACFGVGGGRFKFTPEESDKVHVLAEQLGADGLSPTDRRQVEELVRSIGAAHGDPDESKEWAGSAGQVALVLGLALLPVGGIAVLATRMRRYSRW